MKCPKCGAPSTVKETRETPIRYRRRRECFNGHWFTTEEKVVPAAQIQSEHTERLVALRSRRRTSTGKSPS